MFDKLEDLIGVPYLHKGRDPSIGLDCLGVVVWVGNRVLDTDMDLEKPELWMRRLVRKLEPNEIMAKHDFVLMYGSLLNQDIVTHTGIALDSDNIVHSSVHHRSVVCQRLRHLSHAIKGIYRIK